ncbi:MAG: glycosyl transferase family 2, partial [Gammaproteobacteria bacterium]|nr:glycosyl transferase family 2 [Gammaproteobacteria bacterium]
SQLIFGKPGTDQPFVSIVIPTFNRPQLLKLALESAINQLGSVSYEIIVVDNMPDDDDATYTLMQSFQGVPNLRYYKNAHNIGMCNNWNRCIELAQGRWVTFLHDDDLLKGHFVQTIYEVCQKVDQLSLLFIKSDYLYKPSVDVSWQAKFTAILSRFISKAFPRIKCLKLSDFIVTTPFTPSGITMNRQVALEMGGFDDILMPEDFRLFIKWCMHRGGVYFLNESLAVYRWGDNISLKPDVLLGIIRDEYFLRSDISKLTGLPWAFQLCNRRATEKRLSLLAEKNMPHASDELDKLRTSRAMKVAYFILWPYFYVRRIIFQGNIKIV